MNNTNHYQDICGQVRAHWSARALGPAKAPYLSADSTIWTNVMTTAPFPLAMREDGSSYRLRIRVGGANRVALQAARYAVLLASPYSRGAPVSIVYGAVSGAAPTDRVWYSNKVSSTTPAFLTGQSRGTNAWDSMIALTQAESAEFLSVAPTPVDIAGASSGVPVCMVQCMVFIRGSESDLYYFEATEWYG